MDSLYPPAKLNKTVPTGDSVLNSDSTFLQPEPRMRNAAKNVPTFPKTALSAFRSWRTFLSARRGDVPCPWDCSFVGNNEQRQFAPPYPLSPHLCPQPTAFMGHLTSSFFSFNIFCSFSYSFFLLYPRFSWHDSPLNRNPVSSITEKHGQILLSPLENTKAGCMRATKKNFSSRLDRSAGNGSCPF